MPRFGAALEQQGVELRCLIGAADVVGRYVLLLTLSSGRGGTV
jgi:hypothetical protein